MKPHIARYAIDWTLPAMPETATTIAQLVARVYDDASMADRARLLEQLLKPLDAASLARVADGAFARLRLAGGWHDFQLWPDDVRRVRTRDVVALVETLQPCSRWQLDGLSRLLRTSPSLSTSTSAALLVQALAERRRGAAPLYGIGVGGTGGPG
jgi:hypothetical protein